MSFGQRREKSAQCIQKVYFRMESFWKNSFLLFWLTGGHALTYWAMVLKLPMQVWIQLNISQHNLSNISCFLYIVALNKDGKRQHTFICLKNGFASIPSLFCIKWLFTSCGMHLLVPECLSLTYHWSYDAPRPPLAHGPWYVLTCSILPMTSIHKRDLFCWWSFCN